MGLDLHANENANKHLGRGGGMGFGGVGVGVGVENQKGSKGIRWRGVYPPEMTRKKP